MSSAAKQAANIANAQFSTGPRTDAGKSASAKNATKTGLFSARDFIRPGEESIYAELCDGLQSDLAPVGTFESGFAVEIRRAMWRLHRCAEIEATMLEACAATLYHPEAVIPGTLQFEATAQLQLSVDRARSNAHRIIYRCTAELRKLQTERQLRFGTMQPALRIPGLGLSDTAAVIKGLSGMPALKSSREEYVPESAIFPEAFDESRTKQTQQSKNSQCICGSGLKYKRCCAMKMAA